VLIVGMSDVYAKETQAKHILTSLDLDRMRYELFPRTSKLSQTF